MKWFFAFFFCYRLRQGFAPRILLQMHLFSFLITKTLNTLKVAAVVADLTQMELWNG